MCGKCNILCSGLSPNMLPNAALATKSDTATSPNIAPATKSYIPTSLLLHQIRCLPRKVAFQHVGNSAKIAPETKNDTPSAFRNPSTLLCSILLYSSLVTLLLSCLLDSTVLYCTPMYSTVLYSTLLYSTLLYSTLLYSTQLCTSLLYFTLVYSILPLSLISKLCNSEIFHPNLF